MKYWILSLAMVISMAAFAEDLAPLTSVVVNGKAILANSSHLTVYTYDVDRGSVSNCYNGCASAWPPVLLPAGSTVEAPLGTTPRTDGTTQITVGGKPVYLFAGDSQPGDTHGDGLGGVWHVVLAPQ